MSTDFRELVPGNRARWSGVRCKIASSGPEVCVIELDGGTIMLVPTRELEPDVEDVA